MSTTIRRLVTLVSMTSIVVACGNAAEPSSETTEAPLSANPGEVASPPPEALRGGPPHACLPLDVSLPFCSFGYSYEDSGDPTQKALGCSPVYRYMNGANAGVLGGVGSFCPDTPGNRAYLHEHHYTGYLAGHSDTCLNVPCGQIFVFWSYFIGPGCPSSCRLGSGAPGI